MCVLVLRGGAVGMPWIAYLLWVFACKFLPTLIVAANYSHDVREVFFSIAILNKKFHNSYLELLAISF